MKSIFLSVVVICALVIAGIGGTLAGFVDTEQSVGNTIVTGSLDLRVSDGTGWKDDVGEKWGDGVPTIVTLTDVMPSKWYSKEFYVQDAGQAANPDGTPEPCYLYLFFKNMCCDNVNPTHGNGYDDPEGNHGGQITQIVKPEPELVAEYGGKVDCREVDGKGWMGDNCCMRSATFCEIWVDGVKKAADTMYNFEGKHIYLGEIMPCGALHTITLWFKVAQPDDTNWKGWEPLKYWPSNVYQLDKLSFDIEVDLLQEYFPPDWTWPV
jgi:predicted ribosomally synthesized peptide with SipW-like signal peptide